MSKVAEATDEEESDFDGDDYSSDDALNDSGMFDDAPVKQESDSFTISAGPVRAVPPSRVHRHVGQ